MMDVYEFEIEAFFETMEHRNKAIELLKKQNPILSAPYEFLDSLNNIEEDPSRIDELSDTGLSVVFKFSGDREGKSYQCISDFFNAGAQNIEGSLKEEEFKWNFSVDPDGSIRQDIEEDNEH